MKIELKNREKSVYKKLCCTKSAAGLKEDIVVPDTMEDILRILGCRHQCRIRSKNLETDCVSVGGELDVTVLYIPETGEGIRTISAVIPFEVKLDAPGADSTSVSIIDTSVLDLEVKPVNPRKVSVNADLCVTQCCYKYLDYSWAEAPDAPTEKLFIKNGEIDYQGDFTYEADNFLARMDKAAIPAALSFMEKVGRILTAKIDANRPGK